MFLIYLQNSSTEERRKDEDLIIGLGLNNNQPPGTCISLDVSTFKS